MTREEARDKLIDHRARLDMIIKMAYGKEAGVSESFDVAIQALEILNKIEAFCHSSQSAIMPYEILGIIKGENVDAVWLSHRKGANE